MTTMPKIITRQELEKIVGLEAENLDRIHSTLYRRREVFMRRGQDGSYWWLQATPSPGHWAVWEADIEDI